VLTNTLIRKLYL